MDNLDEEEKLRYNEGTDEERQIIDEAANEAYLSIDGEYRRNWKSIFKK